jgi:hypothetical protein
MKHKRAAILERVQERLANTSHEIAITFLLIGYHRKVRARGPGKDLDVCFGYRVGDADRL